MEHNLLDFDKVLSETLEQGMKQLKERNVDTRVEDFFIVQPMDDLNCLIILVEDNEEGRGIKVKVNDSTIILPHKRGLLDILN